jgi:hypothetical protein
MALLLQDSEQGPDGGIAGRTGQPLKDLDDSGFIEFVNDIHDLALAPA